jgi:hypothetical protein
MHTHHWLTRETGIAPGTAQNVPGETRDTPRRRQRHQ